MSILSLSTNYASDQQSLQLPHMIDNLFFRWASALIHRGDFKQVQQLISLVPLLKETVRLQIFDELISLTDLEIKSIHELTTKNLNKRELKEFESELASQFMRYHIKQRNTDVNNWQQFERINQEFYHFTTSLEKNVVNFMNCVGFHQNTFLGVKNYLDIQKSVLGHHLQNSNRLFNALRNFRLANVESPSSDRHSFERANQEKSIRRQNVQQQNSQARIDRNFAQYQERLLKNIIRTFCHTELISKQEFEEKFSIIHNHISSTFKQPFDQ